MEASMLGTLLMESDVEQESTEEQMDSSMKATGWKIKNTVKAGSYSRMEMCTVENLIMTSFKVMDRWFTTTKKFIQESENQTNETEREC